MKKHQLTGSGGKGSKRRPENKSKFDENFDRIFGTKKPEKEEKKAEENQDA